MIKLFLFLVLQRLGIPSWYFAMHDRDVSDELGDSITDLCRHSRPLLLHRLSKTRSKLGQLHSGKNT